MPGVLNLTLVIIALLTSGCKMWPVSVGIYNQSAHPVQIELIVEKGLNSTEIFPLLVSRFDNEYVDSAFRNLSPLKIDTVETGYRTVYHLLPGECLTIDSYWDDEYRGYSYYQSPEGSSKRQQAHKLLKVSIHHPKMTLSGSRNHLDGLIKALNPGKKVWGIVIH